MTILDRIMEVSIELKSARDKVADLERELAQEVMKNAKGILELVKGSGQEAPAITSVVNAEEAPAPVVLKRQKNNGRGMPEEDIMKGILNVLERQPASRAELVKSIGVAAPRAEFVLKRLLKQDIVELQSVRCEISDGRMKAFKKYVLVLPQTNVKNGNGHHEGRA